MDGIESKRRNRPVEETLAVWKEMVAGSAEGKKHCMRFKISMTDPNKAMRDPVAYRCNDTVHWRTGTKYKAGAYTLYSLTSACIGVVWDHCAIKTLCVGRAQHCSCWTLHDAHGPA